MDIVLKIKKRIKHFLKKENSSRIEKKSDLSKSDYSEFEIKVIDSVREYTMTSPERIVSLIRSLEYMNQNRLEGDIVECGVWKGGSVIACILTLKRLKSLEKKIWLFDTFEGMNQPTEFDLDLKGNIAAEKMKTEDVESSWLWAKAEIEIVKNNISQFEYPQDKVTFVKGPVEETLFSTELPEKIALLRLDTDWYESTKVELEVLYERLVPGGVLIIDDYGHWNGCKKAVDEFFDKMTFKPYIHRIDYTGRIIIKP
ncbi:TylF/MycF/NovP-related O-methyltransferase [Flavobacterium adhaerens]|uniref:TylF/MycF/NovP-related O-methyltransferase n=1 Tax=Flavobacterium adhaerens TaxID=3149043 RepID=UPI0032B3D802